MANFMMFGSTFENQDKYDGFKQLCFDTYRGVQVGYTKEEANKDIKSKFMSIIGCDATSSKKEIKRGIKSHINELFAITEEMIPDLLVSGWNNNKFFENYVDIRNLEAGDTNEFVFEPNDVLTVSELAGGHWDIKRQRFGSRTHQSIPTKYVGLAVYAETYRLLTNAEDWTTFVNKIVEAINDYVDGALYNAMITAGTQLGSQWYKSSAITAGSTDAYLRTLCMDVGMANGTEVVIMGTRNALASVFNLNNVSWASNGMKDEFYTTGRFGLTQDVSQTSHSPRVL